MDQARAALQEARDNLAKTRLSAPIAGRVVRLAVEEGEVAVPGTFSRETGLLMTIADLSVVLAKVRWTRPTWSASPSATRSRSRSTPSPTRPSSAGSPRSATAPSCSQTGGASGGSTDRAVDFDVEITLDKPPAGHPPRPSATARIVTDTRKQCCRSRSSRSPCGSTRRAQRAQDTGAADAGTGRDKKKEREGVFVVRERHGHLPPGEGRASRARSTSRCSTASRRATGSWPAPTRRSAT